jgi:hypothetical protein
MRCGLRHSCKLKQSGVVLDSTAQHSTFLLPPSSCSGNADFPQSFEVKRIPSFQSQQRRGRGGHSPTILISPSRLPMLALANTLLICGQAAVWARLLARLTSHPAVQGWCCARTAAPDTRHKHKTQDQAKADIPLRLRQPSAFFAATAQSCRPQQYVACSACD